MKARKGNLLLISIIFALLGCAGVSTISIASDSQELIVVKATTIHPMTRDDSGGWHPPISDGVIFIRDGKIEFVGEADARSIPDGARIIEAAVATPGLIDARSVVGLAGWLNYDHDQEQLEHSSPIQPELAALDAYNARDPLVDWVRSFGVTTLHTGHAPGELISGQTMVVKTDGKTVDDAVMVPRLMVACTLGESALKEGESSPGTRAKQMAMLRQAFLGAQEYGRKRTTAATDPDKDAPDIDLRNETLLEILNGEMPLMVTAHRSIDIQNAIRLAREFKFDLVLDGASEAYDFIEVLSDMNVPVILHPPMMRSSGQGENASMETASKLIAGGLKVAIEGGYESYVPKTRVVLYEAAIACVYGCSFADALGTITISAAELLGIDDRVGSLESGKDADIALYDGDPFEYTNHCIGVLIEGDLVSDTVR